MRLLNFKQLDLSPLAVAVITIDISTPAVILIVALVMLLTLFWFLKERRWIQDEIKRADEVGRVLKQMGLEDE